MFEVSSSKPVVPATGIKCLLPLYDVVVPWLTRESEFKSHLVRAAKLGPEQSILDVGCGTGTLVEKYLTGVPGARLVGVDADPHVLRVAQRKVGRSTSVQWCRAMASALPFRDAQFDAVFCTLVLHHLEDEEKRQALQEMRRVLKPGGQLLLADFLHPRSVFSRIRFLPVRLVDGWSRTALHAHGRIEPLLRAAGFAEFAQIVALETALGTLRCFRAVRPLYGSSW